MVNSQCTSHAHTFAVNGAGRIGRTLVRAYYAHQHKFPNLRLAAINDPHDPQTLQHLLKYDSIHGVFKEPCKLIDQQTLHIQNHTVKLKQSRDPAQLDWGKDGIKTVLECTGRLKTKAACQGHLDAGASQVIISAPSPDADATVVLGVNDDELKVHKPVISIGSCTTNALAPLLQLVDQWNAIQSGFMTTIHAYTNDQSLVDNHHSDLRRARAAGYSIIPTKTGAAKTIGVVMPHLEGKLQGYALRVPTANVSALEVTLTLNRPVCQQDWLTHLAQSPLVQSGILACEDKPLVSIDYNQHPSSAIIDMSYTQFYGNTLKLLAWYDNEWAYALRMLDTAQALYTHAAAELKTETAYG